MAKSLKPATDAVEILHRRCYEDNPGRLKKLEEARANEEIARKIHDLRTAAGLTRTQLAKRIGTTASVICRLEDADFQGHSLAMLRRIGGALNQRVEIRLVPVHRAPWRTLIDADITPTGVRGLMAIGSPYIQKTYILRA